MDNNLHIAIIMDGNRRYAKENGMLPHKGHTLAIDVFKKLVEEGKNIGLSAMTFYAFSTENWKRSKSEVKHLMMLLESCLTDYIDDLKQNKIQLRHLGRKDRLPARLTGLLQKAEEETIHDAEMIVNLAIDYGARDEIIRAAQRLAEIHPLSGWSEEAFEQCLDTAGLPPVDILVRPGGEQRISNFLLWQCAYSEFFFEPFYFPEFTPEKLHDIIVRFHNRNRRFGS